MTESRMYPALNRDLGAKRSALAPHADAAFRAFGTAVFADGAMSTKAKQLIAVAVAHVTQCPYCIRGHAKAALCQQAFDLGGWCRRLPLPHCPIASRDIPLSG